MNLRTNPWRNFQTFDHSRISKETLARISEKKVWCDGVIIRRILMQNTANSFRNSRSDLRMINFVRNFGQISGGIIVTISSGVIEDISVGILEKLSFRNNIWINPRIDFWRIC